MVKRMQASYGMPYGTKDEEMLRGFSETLSEGVLWETGGIEMELRSINLYFSILCACPSRKTGLSTMSNGDNVIYIPDDL